MRLVWVSRHDLKPENHEILKKAFGDYEVIQFPKTVKDINTLIDFANANNADAYVVVLPPDLIQQLLVRDNRPIYRFIVERREKENGEVEFIPKGLERIVRIEVIVERIA